MRPLRHALATGWALALAACAVTQPGPPVLPGRIDAPPPPIAAAGDALLTGTVWAWQGTRMKDGTRVVPQQPERYTLEFAPGGTVTLRADCNRGSGSYLLNDASLSFGPLALTKMLCPPGTRDAEYLKELAAVTQQSVNGDELVLTLAGDAGSMRFITPARQ